MLGFAGYFYQFWPVLIFAYWGVLAVLAWVTIRRSLDAIQQRRSQNVVLAARSKSIAIAAAVTALLVALPVLVPRAAYVFDVMRVRLSSIPDAPVIPIRELLIDYQPGMTTSRGEQRQLLDQALVALAMGLLDRLEVAIPDAGPSDSVATTSYKVYSIRPAGTTDCVSRTAWGDHFPTGWSVPLGTCLVEKTYRKRMSSVQLLIHQSESQTSYRLVQDGRDVAYLFWASHVYSNLEPSRGKYSIVAKPAALTREEVRYPLKKFLTSSARPVIAKVAPIVPCDLPESLANAIIYAVDVPSRDGANFPQVKANLSSEDGTGGVVELTVNEPGKSVVLQLKSYYPIIWRIKRTERTKIVFVGASGYHGQAIEGVSRDVPVSARSEQYYSRLGNCTPLQIREWSNRSGGERIDVHRVSAEASPLTLGRSLVESDKIAADKELWQLSDFVLGASVAPGEAGLLELEAAGKLKKLIREQGEHVLNKLKPSLAFGPNHRSFDNAYLILEKLELPRGLYGGHSVTLFLPSDVSEPDGDLGHSNVSRLKQSKVESLAILQLITSRIDPEREEFAPIRELFILVAILLMFFMLFGAMFGGQRGGPQGAKKGVVFAAKLYAALLVALIVYLLATGVGFVIRGDRLIFTSAIKSVSVV